MPKPELHLASLAVGRDEGCVRGGCRLSAFRQHPLIHLPMHHQNFGFGTARGEAGLVSFVADMAIDAHAHRRQRYVLQETVIKVCDTVSCNFPGVMICDLRHSRSFRGRPT